MLECCIFVSILISLSEQCEPDKFQLNEDIEPVEGMLEAPTAGLYSDSDEQNEFHEFSQREITLSEHFK